uniref:Uncharacterized protein n=1 Tax=Oryza nivara TaxID=4536 RepID=A0A0E0FIK9_ORYNI
MWVVVKCSAVEAVRHEEVIDGEKADNEGRCFLRDPLHQCLSRRRSTTTSGRRLMALRKWERMTDADFCYFADLARTQASLAATLYAFVRCGTDDVAALDVPPT